MVLAFSLSTNAQDSTKVDNFKKTDEVLSKVVEKALNVAEKTGEFAIEQAPLLLKEFYSWHIAKNSLIKNRFLLLMLPFFVKALLYHRKHLDSLTTPDRNL